MRKQLFSAILAGLVALGFSGPVSAEEKQEEIVPAQIAGIPFNKYVQTSGYITSLGQTVTDYEQKFGECEGATYDARMQIGQPQKPVAFPGKTGTVPQWIEVVRVEGCEEPYVRGVLVAIVDDKVSFYPLLKGNGLSGVFAQKAVLGKLLEREEAEAKKAGCNNENAVRITQHDMVDKQKTQATGAWDEVWHVKNCKGPRFVQVTFTSKDDGIPDFKFQDIEMKKN